MDSAELQNAVLAISPQLKLREKADRPAVEVPPSGFLELMTTLSSDPKFSFDMLCAHSCIDWSAKEQFELFYQLYSTTNRHYLMVSVFLPRANAEAHSVRNIWEIAEWHEREVYDMFGVRYSGHNDLRRILLEDDWKGHPLLKDYKDDFMLERPW